MRTPVVKHKDVIKRLKERLSGGVSPMSKSKVLHLNAVVTNYIKYLNEKVLEGEQIVLTRSIKEKFGILAIDKKLFYEVKKMFHKFFHLSTRRIGMLYRINILESNPIKQNGYYFVSDKKLHADLTKVLTETDLIYSL